MQLTELELLYLRRIVQEDVVAMKRRLEKYRRYSYHYELEYQKKLAITETELSAMQSILEKIDIDIAWLSLH